MSLKVVLPPDEPPDPGRHQARRLVARIGRRPTADLRPLPARLPPRARAIAGSASSARTATAGSSRPPTAAAPASASTRSRRSRSTSSIPARRSSRSARPAATWAASSARTGPPRKSREVEAACEAAAPRGHRRAPPSELGCRSVAFTYNDPIVWAEYAIDTARACRAAGRQDRGGHVRLHHAGGPRGVLRVHGRGQRRSEGVHRGVLPEALRRPPGAGARYAPLAGPRDGRLGGDHQPGHPAGERLARRDASGCATGSSTELGPDVPLHFSAFHPDFKLTDRGPTPPATLVDGLRHRPRGRAALCLYGQR